MKSAFKALNVDSDQESEDEVDNTKEIQIEETLKLYQTALKFHSEGPASFPQADAAYKALFKSEIFKYQESLSEFRRHELYGDSLVFDTILDDIETEPTQPAVTNDSGANTLHQVLHLSYKNHGQFMLETMQHWIKEYGIDRAPRNETTAHILSALTCFAESLDKDDTDLDLWLRAASVAALLGSRRITRFCLEAVLDGDDELVDSVLRLPGLEEGFAGQQLRELVEKLEDTVSLMQAPLSTMSRKKLSETLKKRLNPYPFAPLPSEVAQSIPLGHLKDPSPRIIFKPSKWDWAGLGEAILHNYHAEQSGFVIAPLGSAVCIDIPSGIPSNADNAERSETENAQAKEPTPVPVVEDSIQRELAAHEDTPEQQSPEASAPPSTTEQDVVMEDQPNDNGETDAPQEATSAPSRKRSTDSAGFPETAEGGRARSKRLRARDSIADGLAATETVATDGVKQFEEKLYPYSHADKCLFEIINDILERLGIEGMGSPKELKDRLSDAQANGESNAGSETAEFDMYTLLQGGTAQAAAVILSTEHVDLGGMSREAGLNAFLGYAKANSSQACSKPDLVDQRLLQFAADVNAKWLSVQEVALAWLEVLLRPGTLPNPTNAPEDRQSSYVQYRWAEDLKRHLVQIIVHFDETIYEAFQSRINKLDSAILGARTQSKDYALSQWDRDQIDMAQTLFELHLDIYSLIRHPHSGVDSFTQVSQKDRLGRWSILARDALQLRSECHPNNSLDNLAIRHIWASVFHLSVDDEVQPDHVIQAMEELKSLLRSLDGPVIELQNNAVMPDLSIAAVDRELARISMKDFFLKVFEQEDNDPVAVIESLEPILETTEARLAAEAEGRKIPNGEDKSRSASPSTASPTGEVSGDSHAELSPFNEMRRFLEATSVHLKLSLWQRLREAYETIEYTPKVVSCYLRSIETLVGDFKTSGYTENSPSERQMTLLTRFRIIDEIILRTLQIIKSDKTAFDALSYEHVQTSIKALAELLRVLWAGNMLEDMVRVGQLPGPRFEGFHHTTFQAITNKLHDLQLRTWVLQYYLLKEGISQTPEAFSTPSEEQFEFLRHVHHATGVRGFCHFAKWIFLRLAKDELLRLDDVIDGNTRDNELSQVLYDLYGLKVFVNPTDCLEFYSNNEILDKRSALQLLSFVQSQARKTNIKDLSKTELKVSIDKVHGCLGRPKTNEDISHNRKVLTTYFKSAINPISLFECLKGVGTLSTKSISPEVAIPASKGWYFLMGNIALNKFRSQKRLNPGPTEDLNFAQAFFLQDLEYSVDRWETWYRLAQVYDSQLEEAVSWTAEKLNSNSLELMNFQRGAINCYTLATACAVRDADAAPQTLSEISELYTDFGNRIYSSSREPFAMTAFTVRDAEQKYYSGDQQRLLYQNLPFHPLQPYTAWKFASVLFKRAIQGKPDKWWYVELLSLTLPS